MQSIASFYHIERWQEIVMVNSLRYPFIDDSVDYQKKEINIKYIGDTLLIPSNYEQIPALINDEELQKMAYGCDYDIIFSKIDEHGVINIETGGELKEDETGDLLTVTGLNNLKQAILLRLITPRGSLVLHPEYGSDLTLFLGKPRTEKNLIKIKLETEQAIKTDFRIQSLKNMKVQSTENGGIKVDCYIKPIDPYSGFRFVHEFL